MMMMNNDSIMVLVLTTRKKKGKCQQRIGILLSNKRKEEAASRSIVLIPPLMFCNGNQSRRCPCRALPLVVVNSFCLAPIPQNHIYTSQNGGLARQVAYYVYLVLTTDLKI